MHKLDNLVLIAEAEKTIRRYSGKTNMYTFLHPDFVDVEFYAAKRYILFEKEGREEYFFFGEKVEEYDEVLPVSWLSLLV